MISKVAIEVVDVSGCLLPWRVLPKTPPLQRVSESQKIGSAPTLPKMLSGYKPRNTSIECAFFAFSIARDPGFDCGLRKEDISQYRFKLPVFFPRKK